MATRIRLQRHGRKGRPIFHIVVADHRSKRDGSFIEKLGIYNPNTNPASIDLNFERALHWVQTGAQPSDTARAILKYKGVAMKKHLLDGVKKGAFNLEQAEEKFNNWLQEKENAVLNKRDNLSQAKQSALAKQLEAEKEVSNKRLAAKAAAEAPAVEEVAEEVQAEETSTEEAATEEPTASAE
jgi:small subunit ribosomal protein S16